MKHSVQWQTASPLWSEALKDSDNKRFKKPALLRFAGDSFMEALQGKLDTDFAKVSEFVTQRETWQTEAVGWLPDSSFDPNQILKLYQPAHQRFYLVTASLVCQSRGLPERAVNTSEDETTSFVLRRLVARNGTIQPSNPSTFDEYGWEPEKGWTQLSTPNSISETEERLPMFGLNYCANGRLLAGLVPVASRETFQAAPELSPMTITAAERSADPMGDPRLAQFEASVITALLALSPPGELLPEGLTTEQAREALAFAMLDLLDLLDEHLPNVRQAIVNDIASGLSGAQLNLFNKLSEQLRDDDGYLGIYWDGILRDVWAHHDEILTGALNDSLSLVVDDLNKNEIAEAIKYWNADDTDYSETTSLNRRMKDALGSYTHPADASDPVTAPKIDTSAGAVYAVRCVYDRPKCLKPSNKQVVSELSQAFQLASFFDPEAPARPVRIALPVDTSISGLRSFPKNVSILVSNKLRQQIERVQGVGLEDLDNGELNDEQSFDLGMICSLSIPIITICALILLMIIVQLLNIIFWWLPFFKICFPLNLKAE
jgi:hypothetical protein